nr:AraC family transcriptional regulator [uncultured Holophaga sp.]
MNIQEFEAQLHGLTPFEELCRQIHFCPDPARQKDDESYRKLLASLVGNNPGIPPRIQVQPGFVTLTDTTDVSVVRQMRYTPEFLHSHGNIEVIYIYEGQCTMHSAFGDTPLHEGDLCLVSPNTLHSHGVEDDTTIMLYAMIRRSAFDTVFYDLLTHDDIISTFLIKTLYSSDANQTVIFRTKGDLELKRTFLELYFECEQSRPLRGAMLNNLSHRLLILLLRNHQESAELIHEGNAKESAAMVAMLQFVHDHYRTVTLASLASNFGISPQDISRRFKRYTGKTFNETVREIRIHKAARLLDNPKLSLAAIAASTGYTDASHLHKEFKHFYGTTPGAYRQRVIPDVQPPSTTGLGSEEPSL